MWAQIINAILGVAVMAAPEIFSTSEIAYDNNHIVGPVIVAFSIISLSESTRQVRFLNVPLGVWLIISSFIFFFHPAMLIFNIVTGALITGLSFVKGRIRQNYGGGWTAAFKSGQFHHKKAKEKYGKL